MINFIKKTVLFAIDTAQRHEPKEPKLGDMHGLKSMIKFASTDTGGVPKQPEIGDAYLDENGHCFVFTNAGWQQTQESQFDQIAALRAALAVYADPDNWIGNEFWAEGGGDPKRFAREAMRKI